MKKSLIIFLIIITINSIAYSIEIESDVAKKYLTISDTWGILKYLHPYAIDNSLEWNNAFIDAIKDLEHDQSHDSIHNIANTMLKKLNDPHSYIIPDENNQNKSDANNNLYVKNHIIYLQLNDHKNIYTPKVDSLLKKTIELSYKEQGLILDLRNFSENREFLDRLFSKNHFISSLICDTIKYPDFTYENYIGYPEEGNVHKFYKKQKIIEDSEINIIGKRKHPEIPIVVIINSKITVPASLEALSFNKKAQFISVNDKIISLGRYFSNDYYSMILQLLFWSFKGNTYTSFINEFYLNHSEHELYKEARSLLKRKNWIPLPQKIYQSDSVDKFSDDSVYPDKEHRILALAKLYIVTKYFDPHKNLMKLSPEDNFIKVLPDIISASDSLEYNLALSKFLSNLNDSHCTIKSSTFENYFFSAGFPFEILKKNNHFFISKVLDKKYAKENNIRIGDELTIFNKKPLIEIYEQTKQFLSASNESKKEYYVSNRMLDGAIGEKCNITIIRKNLTINQTLQRIDYKYLKKLRITRNDTIKVLKGNIVYVDMNLLSRNDVPKLFNFIQNAKGVIFDMRGYPTFAIFEIQKYLTDDKHMLTAKFETPVFNYKSLQAKVQYSNILYDFTQGLEKKINCPAVVLMNETTQSRAEYVCSVIKELTGATLIGRQTSGADGAVSMIRLPGKIQAYFTATDPQDPRGNSQQGIGLLPDIEVRKDIKLLDDGEDQILEKAINFFKR